MPGSDDDTRLAIAARLHGGVVPVPFLGTTWRQRGPAYWRRRAGAVTLFAMLTLVVGVIAAGFTVGIVKGTGARPIGIALAMVYDLTVLLGLRTGLRQVARAPDDRRGAPRVVFPAGCLAFVIAPFAVGVCLAVLGSMFGRDFIGERRAREVTARLGR
jgi:hypothetical protein